MAKEIVGYGYVVFLGSRDLQKGQQAAAEIGGGARAIQLDVTDEASVAAAAEQVSSTFGRLDLLVNNAAIGQSGRFAAMEDILAAGRVSEASLEEIKTLLETNVYGVLRVTKALLPLVRLSATGRIVNVSSAAASLS